MIALIKLFTLSFRLILKIVQLSAFIFRLSAILTSRTGVIVNMLVGIFKRGFRNFFRIIRYVIKFSYGVQKTEIISRAVQVLAQDCSRRGRKGRKTVSFFQSCCLFNELLKSLVAQEVGGEVGRYVIPGCPHDN